MNQRAKNRRSRRAAVALLALASLSGAGCTALGLDHYRLAQCTTQDDCEGLNRDRHIGPEQCLRFTCVVDPDQNQEQTCRLRPRDVDGDGDPDRACGGTDCDDSNPLRSERHLDAMGVLVARPETCDGIDNNCNTIVDEGSALFNAPAAMLPVPLSGAGDLRSAASTSGQIALLVPPAAAGATTQLVQPTMTGGTATSLRFRTEAPTGQPFGLAPATTGDGADMCFASNWSDTSPWGGGTNAVPCSPGQAAGAEVDSTGGRWILAAIEKSTCAGGVLRLGVFTLSTSGPVDQFGPPRRSPIADGMGVFRWPVVGPDGMTPDPPSDMPVRGACTGHAYGRMPEGVSRPAVVGLGAIAVPASGAGRALPQALGAWLGRPDAACGASAAPVEAAGLWLESGAPAQWSWVNATGSGMPETLGSGRGDGVPAIVAIAQPPGYLVAFAAAAGGIALRFVSAVDTSVVAQLSPDPGQLGIYDLAPNLVRRTPALQVRDLGTVLTASGMIESVVLAGRGAAAPAGDIGLAFQTGCAASSQTYFTRLHLDAGATAAQVTGTPLALGGVSSGQPQLQYTASGLLAAGGSWNTHVVPMDGTGGWWATWIDGSQTPAAMVVQRVAEMDGQFVDPQPVPVTVTAPAAVTSAVMMPAAPTGDHRLTLGFLDARGAWLTGAACGGH